MQGTLAVDLALEHQPGHVLLDLHLPDLPGQQVLQRLRADPRTQRTHHRDRQRRRHAGTPVRQLRDLGADDYLAKPYDVQQFLEVVDRALSNGGPTGAATHADADADPAGF
jgi:DNA-binding response OmpR family regulator